MAYDEFQRLLLERRQAVLRRSYRVEDELVDVQGSTQPEPEEQAQEDLVEHLLLSLDERSWDEIREIDAAQQRIVDGTYGVCEVCGTRIPEARLRALPTARTHVEHTPAA